MDCNCGCCPSISAAQDYRSARIQLDSCLAHVLPPPRSSDKPLLHCLHIYTGHDPAKFFSRLSLTCLMEQILGDFNQCDKDLQRGCKPKCLFTPYGNQHSKRELSMYGPEAVVILGFPLSDFYVKNAKYVNLFTNSHSPTCQTPGKQMSLRIQCTVLVFVAESTHFL